MGPAAHDSSHAATLRLFLGPGSVRVVDLSDPAESALGSPPRGRVDAGSMLAFTAGSDERTLRRTLAALVRELGAGGAVALVVVNRFRATISALLARRAARGPSLRSVLRALREAELTQIEIHPIARSAQGTPEIGKRSRADAWRAESYLVVARARSGGRASQLDAIVQCLGDSACAQGMSHGCRVVAVSASAKEKSLATVACAERELIVRIPHSQAAFAAEARAHAALEALRDERRLAGRAPQPVAAATAAGQAFFAETRSPGTPLAFHLSASNRSRYAIEVGTLLAEMNPAPGERPQNAQPAVELLPALVEPVLACLGDPRLRLRALEVLGRLLDGATCAIGRMHGDLSASNLLVERERICGLIDWENSSPAGPMLLDAFNYLDSVQRHCSGSMTLADTVPMLAAGAWPVEEERRMLQRHFDFCCCDRRFRSGFALLYFFSHVGPLLRFADPGSSVEVRVRAMLERVLGAVAPA